MQNDSATTGKASRVALLSGTDLNVLLQSEVTRNMCALQKTDTNWTKYADTVVASM